MNAAQFGVFLSPRFDTVNFVPEHETADQLERFGTDVIPAALQLAETRAGR
jgi:hypothetical protein